MSSVLSVFTPGGNTILRAFTLNRFLAGVRRKIEALLNLQDSIFEQSHSAIETRLPIIISPLTGVNRAR
jgi:hypothetical protein